MKPGVTQQPAASIDSASSGPSSPGSSSASTTPPRISRFLLRAGPPSPSCRLPPRTTSGRASLAIALVEIERGRVDAVTQPGGVRAVLEHVAEVRIAAAALDLGADHAVADIAVLRDVGRHGGPQEARPAAA